MSRKDTCDVYCFDEEKVNRIRGQLAKEDLESVAMLFKALADENRAKIAYCLSRNEELCVCDISNSIGTSVATASHHLRTLYKHGIVKYRKEGKLAFYSLDDDHVKELMNVALAHVKEGKIHG